MKKIFFTKLGKLFGMRFSAQSDTRNNKNTEELKNVEVRYYGGGLLLIILMICLLVVPLSGEVLNRSEVLISPKKLHTSSLEVYFEFESAKLSKNAKKRLKNLSIPAGASVRVSGYTDSLGPKNFNVALSKKRAQTVVEYLKKRYPKLDPKIAAMGESSPAASNRTVAGRKQNRRVVITISKKGNKK